MNKNIGSIDRTIRVIIGLAVVSLGVSYGSWWGAIGIVPLLTAFMRWCPAYNLLGISTGGSCSSSCCSTSK